MGRDPEAADGGISGRGILSFLVPTSGHRSLPTEVQGAATRAIRAILDEAYAEASRTLVANMDTLRRLAAYLVEHERVDGTTFDELFEGVRPVPNGEGEWRAATARPRAWGEIVDLAAHRTRPQLIAEPVAATAAGVAVPVVGPVAGVASAAIVVTGLPPLTPDVLAPALRPDQATARARSAGSRRRVVRWRRRPSTAARAAAATGAGVSLAADRTAAKARGVRHMAAELLHRAESWLRQSEAEGEL
jgi:hypothetical protein